MRAQSLIFGGAIFLLSACSNLGSYEDLSSTITTTPLPSSSPSSVVVPAAIHEWEFEGNGTDTGSIMGWNGTLHGSASYTSIGGDVKVGAQALSLTGTAGDYFNIGAQTIPNESSIACWVRWTTGGTGQNTIIANTNTSTTPNGFVLSVSSSTGAISLETGNGTTASTVSSVSLLSSGVYTHVAVTMDSTGGAGHIYFNGSLDSSGTLESGFALSGVSSGDTYIGSMTSNTAPFLGDLDDCQVYNTVLSGAQVLALYGSY
jgi:hypothetical protein